MSNNDYSRSRLAWIKYRFLIRWALAIPGFGCILLGSHAELFPRWVTQVLSGEQAVSIIETTQPAAQAVYNSPLTGVSLVIIGILAIALANRL